MNKAPFRALGDGAAGWLSLAATPACAVMALWTAGPGDGHAAMLCSIAPAPAALNAMTVMYLLMAAFHAPPWLRRLSRLRWPAQTRATSDQRAERPG